LLGLFSFEAAAIAMGPTKRWGRTATAFVNKPTGQVANQSPRRRILRLHVISLSPDNLAARATDASAWLKIRRRACSEKGAAFMGDRPMIAVDTTQRQETRKMLAEAEAKQKQHARLSKTK
jgi:hypothetical protein